MEGILASGCGDWDGDGVVYCYLDGGLNVPESCKSEAKLSGYKDVYWSSQLCPRGRRISLIAITLRPRIKEGLNGG